MAPHLHEPALLLYQPGARARQGMQTAGGQERFDRTIRIELPEFPDSDALQLRAGAFPRGGPAPSLGDLFGRPSGKRVVILRHDCNLTVSGAGHAFGELLVQCHTARVSSTIFDEAT